MKGNCFFIFSLLSNFFVLISFANNLFDEKTMSNYTNDDDILYIHMIPHSHLDPGWLKTVDEYYYGSRKDILPG